MINTEIVFIDHDGQLFQKYLTLPDNMIVSDALEASGILSLHPDIKSCAFGIFSKPVSMETVLTEGDRLEIYRPLHCDPKARRRVRAKK